MLRFLRIEHLAVIDAVEVEFEPGLNVLTGETGAGKSMLVEAVGLLLGGRASADLVRTGEARPASRRSSRLGSDPRVRGQTLSFPNLSSAARSPHRGAAARSSTARS